MLKNSRVVALYVGLGAVWLACRYAVSVQVCEFFLKWAARLINQP